MILVFPHLGITLDHVGKSVDLFGVSIAYYGIIIGMAILIGFAIATSEAKRTRQNPEDYLDMGIIGVIAGIAGARIYYVIFSWDMYKDDLLDIFNLREGGLAIYGGVIAAVISVFVLAKVKHLSPFQIFDTIAMALLNGQMLGRWGNFLIEKHLVSTRIAYLPCVFRWMQSDQEILRRRCGSIWSGSME